MRADTIHVVHEGRLTESGTHPELLALGGRYSQSWHGHQQALVMPCPAPPAGHP